MRRSDRGDWTRLGERALTSADKTLHRACNDGATPQLVAKLIANGAEVDSSGKDGQRPLHLACRHGHAEVVRELIAAGAYVDPIDDDEYTPMDRACEQGDDDVVEQLLSAGAQVNGPSSQGATPLHLASQDGHAAVVARLVEAKALLDKGDQEGDTALHFACGNGHAAVAAQLLQAGASAKKKNRRGATPLHLAAVFGHATVAKELIAHDADLHATGFMFPDPQSPGTLLNAIPEHPWTPLVAACDLGHTAVASMLLAAGAKVDFNYKRCESAMHRACRNGHLACVKLCSSYLARRDGYFAAYYNEERTAEDAATRHGHTDIAAWLARTRKWSTRLHHLEVLTEAEARAELRAGADLRASRAGGPTPLAIAHGIRADADGATPGAAAASLVLRAAEPWSKTTHALFPAPARARAAERMGIGSLLARDPRYEGEGQAWLDIWINYTIATVNRQTDAPKQDADEDEWGSELDYSGDDWPYDPDVVGGGDAVYYLDDSDDPDGIESDEWSGTGSESDDSYYSEGADEGSESYYY